jgi:hypothetical protein
LDIRAGHLTIAQDNRWERRHKDYLGRAKSQFFKQALRL